MSIASKVLQTTLGCFLAANASALSSPIELITRSASGEQSMAAFAFPFPETGSDNQPIDFDGNRLIFRSTWFPLVGEPNTGAFTQHIVWERGRGLRGLGIRRPNGDPPTSATSAKIDRGDGTLCFTLGRGNFTPDDMQNDGAINNYCLINGVLTQVTFPPPPFSPGSFEGGGIAGRGRWDIMQVFFAGIGGREVLRDRITGISEYLSVNNDGAIGDPIPSSSSIHARSISSDGRYALFDSSSPDLDSTDTSQSSEGIDLFIRDRTLRTTRRIKREDGAEIIGEFRSAVLSANGQWVAFSVSGAVEARCALAGISVYLYEVSTEKITCISIDAKGVPQPGALLYTRQISISDDGRFIAYTNGFALVPEDTNFTYDVYVYDRIRKQNFWASASANRTPGNNISQLPLLSDDGRYLAFGSLASNLVPDDRNGNRPDIFVRDISAITGSPIVQNVPLHPLSIGLITLSMLGMAVLAIRRAY